MYAIIDDSGKQFKVSTGDKLRIDRPLEQHPELITAGTLNLDRVLLVGGDGSARVGQPTVAGARVEVAVLRSMKAKKVIVEKFTRRKRYHRMKGHRQNYLEVEVKAIHV